MDNSTENKVGIAVLVSGGGTNLQALINAERDGIIRSGSIRLVISSRRRRICPHPRPRGEHSDRRRFKEGMAADRRRRSAG